jgi:hypothetical protein
MIMMDFYLWNDIALNVKNVIIDVLDASMVDITKCPVEDFGLNI